MMMKGLKKGIVLGLGVASLTKKQLEKKAKVMVKAKHITTKEGKAIAKILISEAKKYESKVKKIVEVEAKKRLSKAEAARLKKKIATLERMLKSKAKTGARKATKKGKKVVKKVARKGKRVAKKAAKRVVRKVKKKR